VLGKTTLLRRHLSRIPLVLLADRDVDEIVAAIEHGVRGYIPTCLEPSEATAAVQCIVAGGTFVPASAMINLAQDQQTRSRQRGEPQTSLYQQLTPRESEVLARLRQRKPNKTIAHELGYDVGPVDGIIGTRTNRGLRRYQTDLGLRADGRLTRELMEGMAAALRQIYASRADLCIKRSHPSVTKEVTVASACGTFIAAQGSAKRGSVLSIGVGQGTCQRDDRLFVRVNRDGMEVACELQQQPLLLLCRPERIVPAPSLKEVADVDVECLSNVVEAPRGNATDPPLVLVRLLRSDSDQLGQLILRQPEHDPSLAYAGPDVPIYIARKSPAGTLGRTWLGHRCRWLPRTSTKHQSRSELSKNQL
jgi:peptidoglycan hydrolase-like protein with peptidoglycan-binding domain